MEYIDYSVEDFVRDEYFLKWIIAPDDIALDFWQKWVDAHPEKRELVQCAIDLILLICNETTFQLDLFDADNLWTKILQRKDKIKMDIPRSEFTSNRHKIRGKPGELEKNQYKTDSDKNSKA